MSANAQFFADGCVVWEHGEEGPNGIYARCPREDLAVAVAEALNRPSDGDAREALLSAAELITKLVPPEHAARQRVTAQIDAAVAKLRVPPAVLSLPSSSPGDIWRGSPGGYVPGSIREAGGAALEAWKTGASFEEAYALIDQERPATSPSEPVDLAQRLIDSFADIKTPDPAKAARARTKATVRVAERYIDQALTGGADIVNACIASRCVTDSFVI